MLESRGYQVTQASTAPQAVLKAKKGSANIVLMDIRLGGKIDGIEAAERIQKLHPETSFIFVSAFAQDTKYRERARKKKIRVVGWIEKPFKILDLIQLIDQERQKLEILASLQIIAERGEDPYEYLRLREEFLPPRLVEELLEELHIENEIRPLQPSEEVPEMKVIARKIDELYDQIQGLIAERAGDPSLKDAVRPLRERLCALQEKEADAMELYFRSQLVFDPREGRELIKQVERRLGKR
jgi:CheY-like chemotaxis protein